MSKIQIMITVSESVSFHESVGVITSLVAGGLLFGPYGSPGCVVLE